MHLSVLFVLKLLGDVRCAVKIPITALNVHLDTLVKILINVFCVVNPFFIVLYVVPTFMNAFHVIPATRLLIARRVIYAVKSLKGALNARTTLRHVLNVMNIMSLSPAHAVRVGK